MKAKDSKSSQCAEIQPIPNFVNLFVCQSESSNSYNEIFADKQVPNKQEVELQLFHNNNFFPKDFRVSDLRQTCLNTDYQSTKIQLHYGEYAVNLTVINLQLQISFQKMNQIGKGQFGTVYESQFNGQMIAIKVMDFSDERQQHLQIKIKKIYQQYFLAFIASQLKAGPKIINCFGYQIVFLKNQAFFAMQLCRSMKPQHLGDNALAQLWTSIYSMHSIQFIHRDIKPSNICWSAQFQKYVFIDFGLSLLIKQPRGKKTMTFFAGTLRYCSPQMKKIFLSEKPGHADLYYNDVIGLQKSEKEFLSTWKYKTNLNQNIGSLQYQARSGQDILESLSEATRLKYYIFHENFQAADKQLSSIKNMHKTCLQIINKTIELAEFPKDKMNIWYRNRKKIEQQIKQNKLRTCQIDIIMSQHLYKPILEGHYPYLAPFFHSLQKQLKMIKQKQNDEMWLSRIYFILNPPLNSQSSVQKCQIDSLQIINFLYQELKYNPTKIKLKVLREILILFFNQFIKFKNRMLLQSISDLFILIHDYMNSVRARQHVLSLTKDPFKYCLLCLKYYIISQKYCQFNKKISNFWLDNIKQIHGKQKSERMQMLMKILENISIIQEESKNEQIDHRLYHTHNKILVLIQMLQSMISEGELEQKQSILRIKIRYIYLFIDYFRKYKSNQQQLQSKNKQLTQKIQKQSGFSLVCLKIYNLQFFNQIQEEYIQKFIQVTDIHLIKQYIDLNYILGGGNLFEMSIILWEISLAKVKQDHQIASVVLANQQHWYRVQGSNSWGYFDICFWKARWVMDIAIIIYLKQAKNSEPSESKLQNINSINSILKPLRQQKVQLGKWQQILLSQIIKIIDIITESSNQQKSCKYIYQLWFELKEAVRNKQQYVERYKQASFNSSYFLAVLVCILEYGHYSQLKNISRVEGIILYIHQYGVNNALIIGYPQFLSQIIKIHKKTFHFQKCYNRYNAILLQARTTKWTISFSYIPQIVYNSVSIYCHVTNVEDIRRLLSSEDFMVKLKGGNFDGHLALMMIFTCHQSLDHLFISKVLYVVALSFAKMTNIARVTILSTYYKLFTKYQCKQLRKKIICLRLQYRSKRSYKLNIIQKYQRIVYKNYEFWPQFLQKYLFRKVNKLYSPSSII